MADDVGVFRVKDARRIAAAVRVVEGDARPVLKVPHRPRREFGRTSSGGDLPPGVECSEGNCTTGVDVGSEICCKTSRVWMATIPPFGLVTFTHVGGEVWESEEITRACDGGDATYKFTRTLSLNGDGDVVSTIVLEVVDAGDCAVTWCLIYETCCRVRCNCTQRHKLKHFGGITSDLIHAEVCLLPGAVYEYLYGTSGGSGDCTFDPGACIDCEAAVDILLPKAWDMKVFGASGGTAECGGMEAKQSTPGDSEHDINGTHRLDNSNNDADHDPDELHCGLGTACGVWRKQPQSDSVAGGSLTADTRGVPIGWLEFGGVRFVHHTCMGIRLFAGQGSEGVCGYRFDAWFAVPQGTHHGGTYNNHVYYQSVVLTFAHGTSADDIAAGLSGEHTLTLCEQCTPGTGLTLPATITITGVVGSGSGSGGCGPPGPPFDPADEDGACDSPCVGYGGYGGSSECSGTCILRWNGATWIVTTSTCGSGCEAPDPICACQSPGFDGTVEGETVVVDCNCCSETLAGQCL